ncbi:carbon-nitrogen hydrolase family protein [Kineococcus sp. TRM81007]|uniref:carbon-nitrogen hydrolase family protein n=1 Tax=Kineococcus sp. TRM81007 TaxID=2925831 RepID=UPI001F59AFC7|nr:carbon-nitrogen hydrolase family protein [Kineococcus sp. TRM81007]MCI2237262.1 carbon-nitrogen hydrolase family protein [Kineococcus sp. TRM81007]
MRIALGQISSTADPRANLELVAAEVAAARSAGARLLVLPEATMCRFGVPLAPVAEPVDGPWAAELERLADAAGLTVVAGAFTPGEGGRVRNTLLVRGGGVRAHYDKVHVYDAFGYAESDAVEPGREPVVVDVDGVGVGLGTCYDVRFPGLFTALAERGASVVAVAASWGAGPGKAEQWELLARARALDSTCFVAACGQAEPAPAGGPAEAGEPSDAPTGVGRSLVAGPLGQVVAQLGPGPGRLVVDVDPGEVEGVRGVLPVLANRRF